MYASGSKMIIKCVRILPDLSPLEITDPNSFVTENYCHMPILSSVVFEQETIVLRLKIELLVDWDQIVRYKIKHKEEEGDWHWEERPKENPTAKRATPDPT